MVHDIHWKHTLVFSEERWLGVGRMGMSWDVFKVFFEGRILIYLYVRVKKKSFCVPSILYQDNLIKKIFYKRVINGRGNMHFQNCLCSLNLKFYLSVKVNVLKVSIALNALNDKILKTLNFRTIT